MGLGGFAGGLGFGIAFVLKDGFSANSKKIQKGMGGMSNSLESNSAKWKKSMGAIAAATGVFASMGVAIGKAAALSDQLIDVQRSTGLTAKELEGLRGQLEDLDTRRSLPELLKLAELGGEMQIAKKDLLEFTKTADMVGLVLAKDFGGNAKSAVKSMGQMAARFGDMAGKSKIEGIQAIGSAMNEMANKSGANAKKTAEFANKMAGLGFASSDAIGLGASLDKLFPKVKGVSAQMIGLFDIMGKDDTQIAGFAKQTNMSAGAFKNLLDNDPNEALVQLAKSFKGVARSDLSAKLTELKVTTPELKNIMFDLAKNIDNVELRQSQASAAMQDGAGLTKEASKRNQTLGASLAKLKNSFQKLTLRIGEAMGEGLQPFIDGLTWAVDAMTKFVRSPFGKTVIRITTSLVAATTAGIALSKAIGMIKIALSMMKKAAVGSILALGPLLLVIGPIVGIVMAVRSATSAFDEFDGTVKSGIGGFMQKLGGVIRGVGEIASSWDSVNQTFSLSGETVKKLDQLGIRDLVISIGTWVVRIKEFLKGVVAGFVEAWTFINENVIQPILKAIGKALESVGIEMGKNTSATEKWGKVGKVVGIGLAIVLGIITVAFVLLGIVALIALIPIILIIALIALAIWTTIKVVSFFIDALSAMWEWVKGLVDVGKQMIMNIWEGAKSVWGQFVDWFMGAVKAVPGLGLAISLFEGSGDSGGSGGVSGALQSVGLTQEEAQKKLNDKLESGQLTEDQVRQGASFVGVDEGIVEGALANRKGGGGGNGAGGGNIKIQPSTVVVQVGENEIGEALVDWQNNEMSKE